MTRSVPTSRIGPDGVEERRVRAASLGVAFIKRHVEEAVVREKPAHDHAERQPRAEPEVLVRERQDGNRPEERGADVARDVGRRRPEIHQQVADRHRPHGEHRQHRVAHHECVPDEREAEIFDDLVKHFRSSFQTTHERRGSECTSRPTMCRPGRARP